MHETWEETNLTDTRLVLVWTLVGASIGTGIGFGKLLDRKTKRRAVDREFEALAKTRDG